MKLKMTPTGFKPERIKPHGVNEGLLKIMPETFLMLVAVKCEQSESNGEDKLLTTGSVQQRNREHSHLHTHAH